MTGDAALDVYIALSTFFDNLVPVLRVVLMVLACIALVLYIRDHWHRQSARRAGGSASPGHVADVRPRH